MRKLKESGRKRREGGGVKDGGSQDVEAGAEGWPQTPGGPPGRDLSTQHLPLLVVLLEKEVREFFCKRLCHN